jgi:hypothetical protein
LREAVALAQVAGTKAAVTDRRTIRAPFRARAGRSDLHAGQYQSEGTGNRMSGEAGGYKSSPYHVSSLPVILTHTRPELCRNGIS